MGEQLERIKALKKSGRASPGELPVEFLLEWYKDTFEAPRTHTGARPSRGAGSSRAARAKAELALTSAERLTLALELSDLCAELAVAGRRALKERP